MIAIEGTGLFGGRACRVALSRTTYPAVRLRLGGGPLVPIVDYRVVDTNRTTTIGWGDSRLSLVEHLFAALAGLDVREKLDIDVTGDELPLLDGGARAWCEALAEIGLGGEHASGDDRSPAASLVVSPRSAAHEPIVVGESVYRFSPARDVLVTAVIELTDRRVETTADWNGTADRFVRSIASARTFVHARDLEPMLAAGLGASVDPASVMVFDADTVHVAGRPFSPDEPARHKLLDLMGDFYLYGGPPRGSTHAHRPGHRANHAAIEEAIARGVLCRG